MAHNNYRLGRCVVYLQMPVIIGVANLVFATLRECQV